MKTLTRIAVVAFFSLVVPQANAEFIPSVLFASNGGTLYTLDPLTGAELSVVGTRSVDALAFQPGTGVVPEPSSIILLGIGCVAMCGYGWRKRRAA